MFAGKAEQGNSFRSSGMKWQAVVGLEVHSDVVATNDPALWAVWMPHILREAVRFPREGEPREDCPGINCVDLQLCSISVSKSTVSRTGKHSLL